VSEVAEELRMQHAESFRAVQAHNRQGEKQAYWVFTKVVRLKKFGRKRLVIVHEKEDLSDAPRCLLTDAQHWESVRVLAVWKCRWPIEVFHEFSKQAVGFEAAQGEGRPSEIFFFRCELFFRADSLYWMKTENDVFRWNVTRHS
jgi:hypothetical protein